MGSANILNSFHIDSVLQNFIKAVKIIVFSASTTRVILLFAKQSAIINIFNILMLQPVMEDLRHAISSAAGISREFADSADKQNQ